MPERKHSFLKEVFPNRAVSEYRVDCPILWASIQLLTRRRRLLIKSSYLLRVICFWLYFENVPFVRKTTISWMRCLIGSFFSCSCPNGVIFHFLYSHISYFERSHISFVIHFAGSLIKQQPQCDKHKMVQRDLSLSRFLHRGLKLIRQRWMGEHRVTARCKILELKHPETWLMTFWF